MLDRDAIDSELRLLAVVRRSIRQGGRPIPSTELIDRLLDERLGAPAQL